MDSSAWDWTSRTLLSPLSGRLLEWHGPFILRAGDEAWPVIEGIPFLRAGRVDMARAAVVLIEAGDLAGATALLLTDQDPYAPDAPPSIETCAEMLGREASFSFRSAMERLGFGRVADYFAHRWTDPTYLSGLALLSEAGIEGPMLELASGVGHFVRAAGLAGIEAAGADLVFAKLWLARRFVCPDARLICFDASLSWPLAEGSFRDVFCHDAFYFIPDKSAVVERMQRLVGNAGRIAIGHAHNASADNHSSGAPLTVEGYAALLPGARLFDDRELTMAFTDGRAPVPAQAAALAGVAAVSLVRNPDDTIRRRIGTQAADPRLRLNPLYRQEGTSRRIAWPSSRYEQEYAELASYPLTWDGPDEIELDGSEAASALFRNRTYVDLPPRW